MNVSRPPRRTRFGRRLDADDERHVHVGRAAAGLRTHVRVAAERRVVRTRGLRRATAAARRHAGATSARQTLPAVEASHFFSARVHLNLNNGLGCSVREICCERRCRCPSGTVCLRDECNAARSQLKNEIPASLLTLYRCEVADRWRLNSSRRGGETDDCKAHELLSK